MTTDVIVEGNQRILTEVGLGLATLRRHYGVGDDRSVFIKAHHEFVDVATATGCGANDYNEYATKGASHLSAAVKCAIRTHIGLLV